MSDKGEAPDEEEQLGEHVLAGFFGCGMVIGAAWGFVVGGLLVWLLLK